VCKDWSLCCGRWVAGVKGYVSDRQTTETAALQGLGFRVQGVEMRIKGSEFGVQRVKGSGAGV